MARRPELDWLRTLVVGCLVPFHAARIFDCDEPFYVQRAVCSPLLTWSVQVMGLWGMELLFVVAGMSSVYALGSRNASGYRRERVRRLLVPFLFGLFVLVPPQAYWAHLARGGLSAGYLDFYRHFFFNLAGDWSGYRGGFTLAHLWFVLYLFAFSCFAPLVVRAFESPLGRRALGRLAALSLRPGGVLVFSLAPLALVAVEGGTRGPLTYASLFLIGHVLALDARFERAIDGHLRAIAPAALLGPLILLYDRAAPHHAMGSAGVLAWGWRLAGVLEMWCWVLLLLGLARRYLSRGGPHLTPIAEATYPCYLLHQPVVVGVGFFLLGRVTAGPSVTFLLISGLSAVLTLALYLLVIRPWALMRWLFGMRTARILEIEGAQTALPLRIDATSAAVERPSLASLPKERRLQ